MTQNTLVDLIEAAYDVEETEQRWLERMLVALRRWAPHNRGAFASVLNASDLAHPQLLGAAMDGVPEEALVAALSLADDPEGLAFFRRVGDAAPVGSIRKAFGHGFEESRLFRVVMKPLGQDDVLFINAHDVDGYSCTLGLPIGRAEPGFDMNSPSLERVQAHLAAAYRLRRYLATATPVDASDAILDPMGRIHHLNQAADTASRRTALRAAAVAVERARGPLGRRDSDQALAMWRVMVMGEWTLVDHFERDGKRFLVARRNRPRPRAHRGLSARECEVVSLAALGYSNKLAAYALGLSPSTVVTHFRNACRKLGVRTRAEAVRAWLAASREPVIDST